MPTPSRTRRGERARTVLTARLARLDRSTADLGKSRINLPSRMSRNRHSNRRLLLPPAQVAAAQAIKLRICGTPRLRPPVPDRGWETSLQTSAAKSTSQRWVASSHRAAKPRGHGAGGESRSILFANLFICIARFKDFLQNSLILDSEYSNDGKKFTRNACANFYNDLHCTGRH